MQLAARKQCKLLTFPENSFHLCLPRWQEEKKENIPTNKTSSKSFRYLRDERMSHFPHKHIPTLGRVPIRFAVLAFNPLRPSQLTTTTGGGEKDLLQGANSIPEFAPTWQLISSTKKNYGNKQEWTDVFHLSIPFLF